MPGAVVNLTATPHTDDDAVLDTFRGRTFFEVLDGRDYLVTLFQITGAILLWRGVWVSW